MTQTCTPWKINGWNLQIIHLERKMIWTKPPFSDMFQPLIFRGWSVNIPSSTMDRIFGFWSEVWGSHLISSITPAFLMLLFAATWLFENLAQNQSSRCWTVGWLVVHLRFSCWWFSWCLIFIDGADGYTHWMKIAVFPISLGIQSPKLRMASWNLKTFRSGGDRITRIIII